jgi:hypothetical protein
MKTLTHSPPSPTTPTGDKPSGKRQKTEYVYVVMYYILSNFCAFTYISASEESPSQKTPKRTPLKSILPLPPKIEYVTNNYIL